MITTEIRLIPELTGQTSSSEQSDLKLVSGYLVYTSSFGGNLVDEFTVRNFLDNANNEQIATDFFNFLQQNFAPPEFNELYYSNVKLANIFNDYYDRTVRSNLKPTNTVADLQLTATTAVTYTNTNFLDYKKRSEERLTVVIGYNTGDSYYVTVPITKSFTILDNQNYDKFRKDSLGPLITKQVAEEFRYVTRKDIKVLNENMIIHTNSFADYVPKKPIGLNAPKLKIQFKTDKIILKKNTQISTVPIEIIFDTIASFEGQTFQLSIESAVGTNAPTSLDTNVSDAPVIGTEIGLSDGQHDDLKSQNILITSGQSAFTATLAIKSQRIFVMDNLNITLVLNASTNLDYNANKATQSYSVSEKSLSIFTEQPKELDVTDNTSIDFVKKKNKIGPQFFIQSFVDLDFNDSESEFWLNPPTTGFPAEFTIATPPVQPVPPAPSTGITLSNAGPVDLTKNALYNTLISLGYTLKMRENVGGEIITMDGNNAVVKNKLRIGALSEQNKKLALFNVQGYNLIKYDVTDVNETTRLLNLLRDFFSPYTIIT